MASAASKRLLAAPSKAANQSRTFNEQSFHASRPSARLLSPQLGSRRHTTGRFQLSAACVQRFIALVKNTTSLNRLDSAHGRSDDPSPVEHYGPGDLRAGLGDGAAFSIMVGSGETYLPAFALAAGAGEIASGLVATIPLLVGSILQLAAPRGLRRCGSFRRWVVLCASLQALAFAPLVLAALAGRVPTLLVFAAASVYWGAGLASGPAWNSWMGTLIPPEARAHYFAKRTRWAQAGLLAGFVGAGVALQLGKANDITLRAFAAVFVIAACCRFISVRFLATHSEPVGPKACQRTLSIGQVRERFGRSGAGVLVYLLAVQSAVQIAGPYFTPYMLNQLQFAYWQYVVLIAAAYISRIVALPALGRFAQQHGAMRLLWLGGVGIAPLSGAWLVSNEFHYLIVLQLTVGVFWAAYELSMFLLFFEAIEAEERTSMLTVFNFANAVATVTGSLLGGLALVMFGKQPATYLTLFAFSSLARGAALLLLRAARPSAALPTPAGEPIVPAARRKDVRATATASQSEQGIAA